MNLTPLFGCFFVMSVVPWSFAEVQPLSKHRDVAYRSLSPNHDRHAGYVTSFFSHLPKHLAFSDQELNMAGFVCRYLHFCPQPSLQADSSRDVAALPPVKPAAGDHLKSKKPVKPKRYTMLDGRDVFVQNCMSCHLAQNSAAPQLADQEAWSWRIKSGVDFLVNGVINGPSKTEDGNTEAASSEMTRYRVDSVETVSKTPYDDRARGCAVIRGGCAECSDAEIIAAVKYMVQAAASEHENYELW